jgi:hypothetical protein
MATKIKSHEAEKAAHDYLDAKAQIKALEEKCKESQEIVRGYVEATGILKLGRAQIYSRKSSPKLVLQDEKKMPAFLRALPAEYITKKPDVKSISDNWQDDEKLQGIMKKYNADISQSSEWHIKHY